MSFVLQHSLFMRPGSTHAQRQLWLWTYYKKGVPLERVSKLSAHRSLTTTERHYAKWVKGRQDRLDALVSATWKASRTAHGNGTESHPRHKREVTLQAL